MGALVIIRGIPGSGKSTIASCLSQNLGARALRIDPDEYRYKAVLQPPQRSEDRNELFDKLANKALEALRLGKIVIWDQALTNLDENLIDRIKSVIMPTPILLVEIEIPEDKAWARVEQREKEGSQTGPEGGAVSCVMQQVFTFPENSTRCKNYQTPRRRTTRKQY